jgi:tetratricopeptide (TPR) repeat protein
MAISGRPGTLFSTAARKTRAGYFRLVKVWRGLAFSRGPMKTAHRIALVAVAMLAAGCRAGPQPGHAGEASIAEAWQSYRLGEYRRALAGFEAVLQTTAETDEDHLQALYGLGATWNLRRPGEDPKKAEEYFQRLLRLAPDHEMAAWSLLALARMKHLVPVGQEPDYPAVRQAYQQVIDRFPGHLAAREAFIYRVATQVATLEERELREAVAALEAFVADSKRRNDIRFVNPALSLLAVSYTALDEQENRLRVEIQSLSAMEFDPFNPFAEYAWAYWNIGTIAEFEVGDFDTARTYYRRLLEEYPTDQRAYAVKVALQRMDDIENKLGKK